MNLSAWITIAAVVFCLAYMKGRHDGAAGPKADIAVMRAQSAEQKEHYDEVMRRLSVSVTKMHEVANHRASEVAGVIRRPAYAVACLDNDGVRIVNDALTNAGTTDPLSTFGAVNK